MRIAQVVPSLESRHGGPSRSVLGLSRGLAALGLETELLTTAENEPSEERPVPNLSVRTFTREWPQSLSASTGMRNCLRDHKHDIVHAHGLWLLPLQYAHHAARFHKRPLIISPRGMMTAWAWEHRRLRKALADIIVHPGALRGALGWHATSDDEAEDIRRLGYHQPICVAPNGIDIPERDEIEAARDHWMGRLPALNPDRTALFYSRFHPKKRVLELIDLWAHSAPTEWTLLLVGIPEAYSVSDLLDYARHRRMANRVAVFDGTEAPAPYAVAAVYLLPSHSENFGLTVAEALAHGLPVVTTDTTPWQGVNEHDCGTCVPWSDFGRAVITMLSQTSASLQARGVRGRQWMQTEFTWERSASRLADFYRTLLHPSA